MRAISTDHAAYQFSLSKNPRLAIEIIFSADGSDSLFLTSHADVAVPYGADRVLGCLEKITNTTQKIAPGEGRSTIGAITLTVVDLDQQVSTWFNAYDEAEVGIRKRPIRVYMGYAGFTWAQMAEGLVQTQIVDNLSFKDGAYTIKCADIQRSTTDDIFILDSCVLAANVSATDLLIPALSLGGSQFALVEHTSAYSDAPNKAVGYLKLEDEVIRHTGTKVDPERGLSFVVDENGRGVLNTVAAAHDASGSDDDSPTEIEEFVYVELPAPKLLHALLTGDLINQNGATLPKSWHLGISSQFIQQTDFTCIGIDLWDPTSDDGFIVRFAGEEKQGGKKFLETQLCLLMGTYMPIYSTGRLGLRRFTSILRNAVPAFNLDPGNVVSHGDLKIDLKQIHNLLNIEWNYDHAQEKLTRQKIVIDGDSRAKNGATPAKSLSFNGLHGSRHTTTTIEGLFDRLRDRFAGPPLTLDVVTLPYTNFLEVGDIVNVHLPSVTDYIADGPLNRAMEIQQVKIDWITGSVKLSLFGPSQPASLITPSAPWTLD